MLEQSILLMQAFPLNCSEGLCDKLKLGECRSLLGRVIYLAAQASGAGTVGGASVDLIFFVISAQMFNKCRFIFLTTDIMIPAHHKTLAWSTTYKVQYFYFCVFF